MGLVALAVVLVLAGTSSAVSSRLRGRALAQYSLPSWQQQSTDSSTRKATALETAAARWKEQTDAIMDLHATVKGELRVRDPKTSLADSWWHGPLFERKEQREIG